MEHYTVLGQVKSKKNNKRICKRGKKTFLIASEDFMKWHEAAVPQVMAQKPGKKIFDGQCKIYVQFYHDSEKRKRDADNGLNSIYDLLVDCGIIQDDKWQIIPKGMFDNWCDKDNPRAEIFIFDKDEKTGVEF